MVYFSDTTNFALSRPASQSSTYIYATDSGSHYRNADLAVDGNAIDEISCAITDVGDFRPWWKVHLEFAVWVTRIEITNRQYSGR